MHRLLNLKLFEFFSLSMCLLISQKDFTYGSEFWFEQSACPMCHQTEWPLLKLLFSLFSPCVYFSPRRTLPRTLNFCMQTYIDPKLTQHFEGQIVGGCRNGTECVHFGKVRTPFGVRNIFFVCHV